MQLDRMEKAKSLVQQVLARDHQNTDALLALADWHLKTKDLLRARETLEALLAIAPAHLEARDRLNNIFIRQRDWRELRKDMERQLLVFSGAEAEYEYSHLALMFGEMPDAWDGFEKRLHVTNRIASARSFEQPRWKGDSFAGKVLLVHSEQGFGDSLMFLRDLPHVKALGGIVLLLIPGQSHLNAKCPKDEG